MEAHFIILRAPLHGRLPQPVGFMHFQCLRSFSSIYPNIKINIHTDANPEECVLLVKYGLAHRVWLHKPLVTKPYARFADISDHLRFVIIYKAGGAYFDVDTVFIRPYLERYCEILADEQVLCYLDSVLNQPAVGVLVANKAHNPVIGTLLHAANTLNLDFSTFGQIGLDVVRAVYRQYPDRFVTLDPIFHPPVYTDTGRQFFLRENNVLSDNCYQIDIDQSSLFDDDREMMLNPYRILRESNTYSSVAARYASEYIEGDWENKLRVR